MKSNKPTVLGFAPISFGRGVGYVNFFQKKVDAGEGSAPKVETHSCASLQFAEGWQQLPFSEAITYFRAKLNLPTATYTDIWKEAHAKAFVVAGAQKADLLTDLRAAVDSAIAKGTTLATFREQFASAVNKHGWSYNGTEGWRSATIYETNLNTSYAAGRWAQLTSKDSLAIMPYLTYQHNDSAHPRPLHVSWDGITLPATDPWWDTHATPNGWGCRCRIIGTTMSEYHALPKNRKAAPNDGSYQWVNKSSGQTETIPLGIDPGWNYNPGKAAFGNGILPAPGSKWIRSNTFGTTPDTLPALTERVIPTGAQPSGVQSYTTPVGVMVADWGNITRHHINKGEDRSILYTAASDMAAFPQEIWLELQTNEESGKVRFVEKYLVNYQIKRKAKPILMVAEVCNNSLMDMRTIAYKKPKNLAAGDPLRSGILLYRKRAPE